MRFTVLALGLLGLATPLTARPSSSVEVLEKLATVPQGWIQVWLETLLGMQRKLT